MCLVQKHLPCCRCVFALAVMAMIMELGVLGVTMCSLLSELRHPHLSNSHKGSAYQRKRKEIVSTSVSLAASCITFGLTILGAGDVLNGVKIAGKRISAAGRTVLGIAVGVRNDSSRQFSSRNCCLGDEAAHLETETCCKGSLNYDGDRQGNAVPGQAQ
jgi:hypothetical protein